MRFDFSKKLVVVTGAARGVGATTTAIFRQLGAQVIALDVDKSVAVTAERVGAQGLVHDVSSPDDWAALGQRIKTGFGRLDAIVNNAAIESPAPFEELALATWRRTIDVNLTGVFLGCQFGVRMARENPQQAPATIVNVASIAHQLSIANDPAYTASKGGVVSLTRAVAHYCGRNRLPVRCNVVSPGAIRTEMLEQYVASCPDPKAVEEALNNIQPLGYMATPENIANLIVYLSSPLSGFITGADLVIDGGASTAARL